MFEIKRDGGWGWLVLFCVTCGQTILGGICVSSGLFYVIFMDAFSSDPVEMSWLCSLPSTLWYLGSPAGSFLTNKYGCRACAFIGGVIAAIGLSLGYFATSPGYLFFSHGVLTGFGFSINYTASMTILNKYFDKFKTMTTGIASIGHNAGLVIYAKFIIYLQETYGWRGMMLIHGSIAFNLCACALTMFPLKITNQQNQMNGQNFNKTAKNKRFLNISVLRKLSFLSFCATNVFGNTSYCIYLLHLPSYSFDAGFTQSDFGTVLIVFGITNVVGKIIYSVLGQHPRVDVTALYSISLTATGVFMFLTPIFLTKAGMLTLAGLVGFFYCVAGALLQAVIFRIVGYERFADGIGMCLPFKAAGNLIGGALAGYLFKSTGSYAFSFYLAGVCMVVSSAFMLQPILHHRRQEKQHKTRDKYKVGEIEITSNIHIAGKDTMSNGNSNGEMNGGSVVSIQKLHTVDQSEEETESFLKTDKA